MPGKKPCVLIVNWGTVSSNYAFGVAKKKGLDIFVATGRDYPKWLSQIVPKDHRIYTNTYDSEKLIIDVAMFMYTRRLTFDAVLTFFEMNIIQTADLANALGYPFVSPSAARKTSGNKLLMRLACRKAGVPTPKFRVFSSKEDGWNALRAVGVPSVLKPLKSGHGYGVKMVDSLNKEKFFSLLDAATRQLYSNADEWMKYYNLYKTDFLLEEYLDGPVLSVDGVIQQKKIAFCGISRFFMSELPLFIQEGVMIPADFDTHTAKACVRAAKQIIAAVELDNCAFHCEMRLTRNGPVLLEIAARPPGGNMTLAYDRAYGINIIDMYLDICLQKHVSLHPDKQKAVIIHQSLFADGWGELTHASRLPREVDSSMVSVFWAAKTGNLVFPAHDVPASLAYFEIKATSWQSALAARNHIVESYVYTLTKTPRAIAECLKKTVHHTKSL